MTTAAEVRKAENWMQRHRLECSQLLQVDESKADNEPARHLCRKLAKAAAEDPAEFVPTIGNPHVAILFRRGVLYFGERT